MLFKMGDYTKDQMLIIGTFVVVNFCNALCASMQAPFYPDEAHRKGLEVWHVGLVFGAFELTRFVVSPLIGIFLKKIGVKKTLNIGISLVGAALICYAFLGQIHNGSVFLGLSCVLRIVEACGNSAFLTGSFSSIVKEFPDKIASMFALFEFFFGIGQIIGPMIGGALYQVGGFTLPFALMGSLLLLSSIFIFFVLPEISDNKCVPDNSTIHVSDKNNKNKSAEKEDNRIKKISINIPDNSTIHINDKNMSPDKEDNRVKKHSINIPDNSTIHTNDKNTYPDKDDNRVKKHSINIPDNSTIHTNDKTTSPDKEDNRVKKYSINIPDNSTMHISDKNTSLDKDSNNDKKLSAKEALIKPSILIALYCVLTGATSVGFLQTSLETHLGEAPSITLSSFEIGCLFMVMGVSYGLSIPVWGLLCDAKRIKNAPKLVELVGAFLVSIGFLVIGPLPLLPFQKTLTTVIIGIVFHGLGLGACLVSGFSDAHKSAIACGFPDNISTYGLISGLWSSVFALGSFVGSVVGSALCSVVTFYWAILMIVVMEILSIVLLTCFLLYSVFQDVSEGQNK